MLVVAHDEAAALAHQGELARFEHATVVVAENGHEHGVAQLRLGRLPVDVEVGRVAARGAVLEHVPPPRVVASRDRHVVGDHVDDLSEPVCTERGDQPGMRVGAAQLGVQVGVVDDVVAMRAAGRGLEERRAVEVADAEVAQVVG
jgi:hypothetical protein